MKKARDSTEGKRDKKKLKRAKSSQTKCSQRELEPQEQPSKTQSERPIRPGENLKKKLKKIKPHHRIKYSHVNDSPPPPDPSKTNEEQKQKRRPETMYNKLRSIKSHKIEYQHIEEELLEKNNLVQYEESPVYQDSFVPRFPGKKPVRGFSFPPKPPDGSQVPRPSNSGGNKRLIELDRRRLDTIRRRLERVNRISLKSNHQPAPMTPELDERIDKASISSHRITDPREFSCNNTIKNRIFSTTLYQHPYFNTSRQNIFKFWAFEDLFKVSESCRSLAPGTEEDYLTTLHQCGDYMSRLPARTLISYLNKEISISGCSLSERRAAAAAEKTDTLPSTSRSDYKLERKKSLTNCLFACIRPNNVLQEKAKFMKSNFMYNPQFTYDVEVEPERLEKYNNPSDEYIPQALVILQQVLSRYGTYENFEASTAGKPISQTNLLMTIKNYLKKEGFYGNVVINLNEGLISRGSMTVNSGRPTLNIRPSAARSMWLEGLLRHEIGTHHIRFHNNRQQPWANLKLRKQLDMLNCNPTEEGLASINGVLFRKDPSLWRSALLYYTSYKAKQLSFSQLFRHLEKFISDVEARWDYCMRTKRGRSDTSLPGCFCKDQVYMNGVIPILQRRNYLDFESLCRMGKVALEDVEKFKDLMNVEGTKIPQFMMDMDAYRNHLDRIVETNQLEKFLKPVCSPMTSLSRISRFDERGGELRREGAIKHQTPILVFDKKCSNALV